MTSTIKSSLDPGLEEIIYRWGIPGLGVGIVENGDELVNLAIQLCSAQKFDLAMDVLEFNRQVFPEPLDSLLFLAKLFLQKDQRSRAIAAIQSVLEIDMLYSELPM